MKNVKHPVVWILTIVVAIPIMWVCCSPDLPTVHRPRTRRVLVPPEQASKVAVTKPKPKPALGYKVDKSMAWTMTQVLVEKRLKAPRTAKWTWGMPPVTYLGDRKYQISHYVDAQNSFGALIRNHFLCTIVNTSGDSYGRWRIEQLIFY